jgi:hypothetical protein
MRMFALGSGKNDKNPRNIADFELFRMVGATGIEPVTPAV